jgi:hypothetical protein
MIMKRLGVGIVVFVLTFVASAIGQQLSVRAFVDNTAVTLNQQVVFTVELSGEGANNVDEPELPDMAGYLSYLGSGGTSQSIQFINGRMSVSKSFSYFFMAAKEGSFQIPAVKVSYKGNSFSSDPINITITKAAVTAPQPQNRRQPSAAINGGDIGGDEVFIRAIPNKTRVYQNEPVIVTYRLYMRASVNSYNLAKLSETEGFWVEDFDMPAQPAVKDEVFNGKSYRIADLKRIAVFPTSPGPKTIGAMSIICDVRVTTRQRDVFDSFFDDPFFGRTVRKTISTTPLSIDVLPLPTENRPAPFSGIVGQFDFTASVDKNEVKTNEAITLKMKVSGTGNIRIIPKPVLQVPSDFEQYQPTIQENINRSGNNISGFKTFEYVLVPRFPGQQRIKVSDFSFFDPVARAYKVITSPDILVTVTKGAGEFVSSGSGLSKEEVRLIGQDIRFIKSSPGELYPIGYRNYKTPFYLFMILLPLLAAIGAVGYRSHLEHLNDNVAYARSRRANRLAMQKLSKAKNLLSEKTQKEFYAEVSRSLSGFAADKLNLSAAGIISTDLFEQLRKRGLDASLIDSFISLIKTCDYQRFAPSAVTKTEMEEFYGQAKNTIIKLEKAI